MFSNIKVILYFILITININIVIFFNSSQSASSLSTDRISQINADNISFKQAENIIIAIGNVKITQDHNVIITDYLEYDIKNSAIKAIGNITIIDKNQDMFYANKLEFSSKEQTGTINNLRALLKNKANFAALKGSFKNKEIITLKDAEYTTCKMCKDKPPQWQIKAKEVIIDKNKQKVIYKKASFEFFGKRIIYSPYFSHSTPNADRKTGILFPSYVFKSDLGPMMEIPFYWNIAPNKDAKIISRIYTKTSPLLKFKYRHLLHQGEYDISGSITYPEHYKVQYEGKKKVIRSNIEAKGKFNIYDNWYTGFDTKFASDKTFLKTYFDREEDYLTSRIFVDRLKENSFLYIDSIYFQGLRTQDKQSKIPYIVPQINYYLETKNTFKGMKANIQFNSLNLARPNKDNTTRLSLFSSVTKPLILKNGLIISLNPSFRADWYNFKLPKVREEKVTKNYTRMLPELKLDIKYPLIGRINKYTTIIEPMANVIWNPNSENEEFLPNEDSRFIELSDVNIFDAHHYSGFDRIEKGLRFNYGINTSFYGQNNNMLNLVFGQSLRTEVNNKFKNTRNIVANQLSDYVGRIKFAPNTNIDIYYRFRLNPRNFSSLRTEIGSNIKYYPFILKNIYTSYKKELLNNVDNVNNRKEIQTEFGINFTPTWFASLNIRNNLSDSMHNDQDDQYNGLISLGGKVRYESDCMAMSLSVDRDFTKEKRDKNLRKSSITWLFNISLKNIN